MKFGERIASFAMAHVGARASDPADAGHALYLEAVAHPGDVGTTQERYYIGPHPPSTCALFASRCLLAAFDADGRDPGVHAAVIGALRAPYVIGAAPADLERVAGSFGAMEHYAASLTAHHPTDPLSEGDCVVISGPPYGYHVLVVTGDAELIAGGRWRTPIVQGGQADGGVAADVLTWEVRSDGLMYPSAASQRAVIAVVRARLFGLDTPDIVATT